MTDLAYKKLNDSEIALNLLEVPDWKIEDGKLTKTYAFGEYLDGIDFAADVGRKAEELNHHPDIQIGYRKVTISVSTHDVGGLSPYDFELARRIDTLV